MPLASSTNKQNIFLRLHPVHRIIIGLCLCVPVFFLIRNSGFSTLMRVMILWDVFAFSLIVTGWIIILMRSTTQIRKFASTEDGSLIYVFVLVVLSSFASMFTVLLLIISKDLSKDAEIFYLVIAVACMMFSWIIVHTTFCFHYAHIYYDDDDENPKVKKGGLDFPSEKEPDYLDFAYFSFVIGMTFQVSDVQITSKKIRRLALIHGLLSFILNTFVVALTINLIAGLKK